MSTPETDNEKLSLRGFIRVNLIDRKTGLVVSDTGYVPNKIQARGFQMMICNPIAKSTATCTNVSNPETTGWMPPNYMAIGSCTLTAIASDNFSYFETQAGSAVSGGKCSATPSFIATSEGGTIRFVGSWAGTSYLNASADVGINAIALFQQSATNAVGMCAITYAASTWSSDQDVKATYELRFSQT